MSIKTTIFNVLYVIHTFHGTLNKKNTFYCIRLVSMCGILGLSKLLSKTSKQTTNCHQLPPHLHKKFRPHNYRCFQEDRQYLLSL